MLAEDWRKLLILGSTGRINEARDALYQMGEHLTATEVGELRNRFLIKFGVAL